LTLRRSSNSRHITSSTQPTERIVNSVRVLVTAAGAVALSVTLGAQWPAFRSADLSRGADGKVDLAGPTPRMPDGKPDLSGVWNYAGVLGFRGGPPPSPPGTPPQATFWNIEAGITDGLPFTPYGADLRKERMAADSKDNPDASCLPMGSFTPNTPSLPANQAPMKSGSPPGSLPICATRSG